MWGFILQFIQRSYRRFFTLKSTASCSLLNAQVDGNLRSTRACGITVDSGIFLAVCGSSAAVAVTQLQRRFYAMCELTRLLVNVFYLFIYFYFIFFFASLWIIPGSLDGYADIDCKLPFVWVALSFLAFLY